MSGKDNSSGVSHESVGNQGIYSEVEIVQHEEHRLERHAGKVVYEAPAERVEALHAKEPTHPTLKPANSGIQRHVGKVYYGGITGGERADTKQIIDVKMVQPTREQIEEFEITRTELVRTCAPQMLETHQNLFYSPSERQLAVMLDKSFEEAIESNAIGFASDPELAMREGLSRSNKLLMCRVAVSPSCRMTNGKLIVKDMRGVQPSFLLTLEDTQMMNQRMQADK